MAPVSKSGVTVTRDAMRSPRFETLARICGLADADHARGKMLRLWDQCTEEGAYVLSVDDVVSVLGENAIDGLARARLGEQVDGGIRIKGTEGRIEWLGDKRQQSSAAGQARVAGAPRDARGRLLPSSGASGSPAVAGGAGPAATSGPPAESSPPITTPSGTHTVSGSSGSTPSGASDLRAGPVPATKRKRRPPPPPAEEFPLPADWTPTPEHIARSRKDGTSLDTEVERFKAHADTHKRVAASWNGAFTTWLINAEERMRIRAGPSSAQRPLKGMSALLAIANRQQEPDP